MRQSHNDMVKRNTLSLHLHQGELFEFLWTTGGQDNLNLTTLMKFIEKELLPDEVFGYIKDGMENATEVVFEGKGENMLATPVPDYKTRLKYIQEYMKLTGHYPDPEEVKNILIQNNNNFSISSRDMDEVDPKKVTADYMELLG